MSMSNSIIFIFSQYKYCGIRYKNLPPHSPFPPGCLTAGFMHYLLIRVQREMTAVRPALLSELLFNPQKLVIFRHTIGTARRSGLICPEFTATAISAMKESSVSPERWEITVVYPAFFAISMASKLSVSVPIWFTLTRIELATPSLIPLLSLLVFVTKRSSPTS